jgi:hypothetical protein
MQGWQSQGVRNDVSTCETALMVVVMKTEKTNKMSTATKTNQPNTHRPCHDVFITWSFNFRTGKTCKLISDVDYIENSAVMSKITVFHHTLPVEILKVYVHVTTAEVPNLF